VFILKSNLGDLIILLFLSGVIYDVVLKEEILSSNDVLNGE
jgi:hypothetical protein